MWPLFKMAGLWRPVAEKALFVIVFCSSHGKEKTLRKGVVGRFRETSWNQWSGTWEEKVGRQCVKFQTAFVYKNVVQSIWQTENVWTRDCTIRKLRGAFSREYQPRISKKRVRSSIIRLLVLATSWPPTEDLHVQNLSRFRVAKYASFVSFC